MYVPQNSDFSRENRDNTLSCCGERPHRRPIPYTPVAHERMVAEFHCGTYPCSGFPSCGPQLNKCGRFLVDGSKVGLWCARVKGQRLKFKLHHYRARQLPDGGLWTYEAKLDGYRCLAATQAVPRANQVQQRLTRVTGLYRYYRQSRNTWTRLGPCTSDRMTICSKTSTAAQSTKRNLPSVTSGQPRER